MAASDLQSVSPFTFLPLGALIQSIQLGDINIVQGFPAEEIYKEYNSPFFGETIGRVANRISGAKINNLNGTSYPLYANNGPNSLHGGQKGWGKKIFDGPKSISREGRDAIEFKYLSRDGEEGYPGSVELRVYYFTSTEMHNGKNTEILEIEYEAEFVGHEDVQETAIAVTNHSYFNLANTPTIEGTEVTLSSNLHQPVDETSIPLGLTFEPYSGIKANETFTLGAQEPDIDHCFIMQENADLVPVDTRGLPLNLLARFYHPQSKVHLEVHSTEPAFQFYTGRYIDVPAIGGLPARGARSGFCVEPCRYVNAVNQNEWRSMVVLKRGGQYGSRIIYKAWRN